MLAGISREVPRGMHSYGYRMRRAGSQQYNVMRDLCVNAMREIVYIGDARGVGQRGRRCGACSIADCA